jgi:hypothetical protein
VAGPASFYDFNAGYPMSEATQQSNFCPENVRLNYESIVNYHNTLVQMRFNVAALYMAAAAFLAAAHLAATNWKGLPILLPLLGTAVTIAAWLLEMRTVALLTNLVEQGRRAEQELQFPTGSGFFQLMGSPQPRGVRLPLLRKELGNGHGIVRYVFSHTFGLELIYGAFLLFWVYAVWLVR